MLAPGYGQDLSASYWICPQKSKVGLRQDIPLGFESYSDHTHHHVWQVFFTVRGFLQLGLEGVYILPQLLTICQINLGFQVGSSFPSSSMVFLLFLQMVFCQVAMLQFVIAALPSHSFLILLFQNFEIVSSAANHGFFCLDLS